jgi:hypothetical protein
MSETSIGVMALQGHSNTTENFILHGFWVLRYFVPRSMYAIDTEMHRVSSITSFAPPLLNSDI